ncbi:hypothetical protein TPHA_0K00150 [Tetrapisispora phaffii CBS 4417]|uniref:serine--tRNA ligase n=1 Tax=Tetrapisispora phaffii (strain ATCC 24235 / CBS 4417 / NBRC 1672 / NRRL Y-8282 / UCD 70-5) TaxID=1071381 RepID=G8BZ21_TETPH|nr:hypothetical protein TPHA_0K00150 [Tetrapisispora phaffii CBS 4417]CCE65149.1 hypothetical protein TPHA_0K00150 [Tetrapisispora phaffii CBS 4417]
MLRFAIKRTQRQLCSSSILRENLILSSPVYDVNKICDKIETYKKSIIDRQLHNEKELLNSISTLDNNRANISEYNKEIKNIQIRRKDLEKLIKEDLDNKIKHGDEIQQLKVRANELKTKVKDLMILINDSCSALPNLIDPSSPISEPEIIDWINPMNEYVADPERNHVDIMTKKNMLNLSTASNVVGTSWYYLINGGALLERALTNYAIEKAIGRGFQFVIPPTMAKREIIDACGFRPRDMNNEQQIYYLNNSNLGLIATAEITLAALGINQTFNVEKGAKKVVGISRSYRAEAGARGRDTKGLYRVHEFSKVELFCWSKPTHSNELLQELKNFQVDLVQSLGIPAKLLNMPANDLGSPAFQKYDIEAWMPGRGNFGEITSTSNCTDFQSRRMNTKYSDGNNKPEYLHTLNGTAMAVPRVIIAIVENFYNKKTNQISIPKPLQKYMGTEYI